MKEPAKFNCCCVCYFLCVRVCVCETYYLKKTNAIYLCFFITFKQQQDDVCVS